MMWRSFHLRAGEHYVSKSPKFISGRTVKDVEAARGKNTQLLPNLLIKLISSSEILSVDEALTYGFSVELAVATYTDTYEKEDGWYRLDHLLTEGDERGVFSLAEDEDFSTIFVSALPGMGLPPCMYIKANVISLADKERFGRIGFEKTPWQTNLEDFSNIRETSLFVMNDLRKCVSIPGPNYDEMIRGREY
jgi:hypothetical protein